MALYRNSTTGFLGEFATNPGAPWSAVTAMPADEAGRITWWRALDVDSALWGQSSAWHPSLAYSGGGGGGGEVPKPQGLAGSGVNLMPARYALFTEPDGLPPMTTYLATVAAGGASYFGPNPVPFINPTSVGGGAFLGASTQPNIQLGNVKRYIFSMYVYSRAANQHYTIGLRTYPHTSTTPAADYTVTLVGSPTVGVWERLSGVIDASATTNPRGIIYIVEPNATTQMVIDGLMLETQIGDGTDPSPFASPSPVVDGAQINNLSVAKLVTGSSSSLDFILSGSGAQLRSSNYSPGASGILVRGDGFAEFQNVTVRGRLNAVDLNAGTINGARFGPDTISSGPIISGQMHTVRAGQYTSVLIGRRDSWSIDSSSSWVGPLSIPANSNRSAVLIWISIMPLASPATDGRIVAGIGKSMVSSLPYSVWGQFFAATHVGMFSFEFYDPSPGIGAITYYLGMQHTIAASGNISVQLNWSSLEISK